MLSRSSWHTLVWWSLTGTIALLIKQHYSSASAAELDWMLQPLALLLDVFTGHDFVRDLNHEWVSAGADVRLVKACAGINFMLMSFVVYAWLFRPERRTVSASLPWLSGALLLLGSALVAAWVTALLANSLRIMAAMAVDSQTARFEPLMIDAADLHRLIGVAIYLPLLSLQMLIGRRSRAREVVAVPMLLYLLLTVIVPLITGNAWHDPQRFVDHLATLLTMCIVMCGLYLLWRRRPACERPHRKDAAP